jgi:hypothetical protein
MCETGTIQTATAATTPRIPTAEELCKDDFPAQALTREDEAFLEHDVNMNTSKIDRAEVAS